MVLFYDQRQLILPVVTLRGAGERHHKGIQRQFYQKKDWSSNGQSIAAESRTALSDNENTAAKDIIGTR